MMQGIGRYNPIFQSAWVGLFLGELEEKLNKEKNSNTSVWAEKCIISPSLICLDMLYLEEQIRQLEHSGIRMLHIDILDGHFSPSMPLGFETLLQLRKITNLPFECHVMADPPEFFVDELLKVGVQQIVFHIETASHVDGLINHIHSQGVRAGVALKPSTPVSVLEYVIEKCDAVLIMQINPGYASSKNEGRVGYSDRKIRDMRRMINEKGLSTKIIIDGRVSVENIKDYGKDIVDIFVGGTTCISRDDISGSVQKIMAIRDDIVG